ncbi:MAG: glycoside hydrolase family 2 protein [Bacteroidales bacterium]|nr:glycoside hydrolase family 2 protein [Bacteroidales bacterium]
MRNCCLIVLLSLFLFVSCGEKRTNPLIQNLDQSWVVTTDTLDIKMQVDIPSVIQADMYENGLIPHPYKSNVEPQLHWIPQHEWTYTLDFEAEDYILNEDVVELVFEGLDTYADVWLNGKKLLHADNMFRTYSCDVKDIIKEKNNIKIKFYPFDKERDSLIETYRLRFPEKYAVMRKAAYQNGWDWAPRYMNMGIWQPVYLKAWTRSTICSASVITNEIHEDKADLFFEACIKADEEHSVRLQLFQEEEKILDKSIDLTAGTNYYSFPFEVAEPKLWNPNELGEQNFYSFNFKMVDNDKEKIIEERNITMGIRTIEMVEEPDSIGTAFYFKVNGIPLYMKGANYIPEEMITSWMSREKTKKLLEQCVGNAHMNMLRVWGGGIYPPDYFFEICDSLGILVWQDFMFAGSTYPYSDEFIGNVKEEAKKQVIRYKNHPSLALWCGNNEISEGYYNWGWQQSMNWSDEDYKEMKDGYDKLFEEMLDEVVSTYDKSRPYWPSSPKNGWGRAASLTEGDVHYWGVWWGELPYEMYIEKVGRFNSEFGYQSYPSMATLKMIDDNPDFGSEIIQAHQKHNRGEKLIMDHVLKYFGEPKDFEDYVYLSQLSQALGMNIAISSQRASRPRSMGSLYWQLNDAWTSISWSSIDYLGNKKALHYKLDEMYAPLLLGLNDKGDDMYEVWVSNDLQRDIKGRVRIIVEDMRGNQMFAFSEMADVKANDCYRLPNNVNINVLNKRKSECYARIIFMEDDTILSERIHFFTYPKDLELIATELEPEITLQDGKYYIKFQSDVFVKDLFIESSEPGDFSKNFFDVIPNITQTVIFEPEDKTKMNAKFKFRMYNR